MKISSMRYGATAAFGSLAISAMANAAQTLETKWLIAVIGSVFVGFICSAIIPYDQKGD